MNDAVLLVLLVLALVFLVGIIGIAAIREANKPRILQAEQAIEASKKARIMAERRWRLERGEDEDTEDEDDDPGPFWRGLERSLAAQGVPVAALKKRDPEEVVALLMGQLKGGNSPPDGGFI